MRGCTDSTSLGYLSTATIDDGSCRPKVPGCSDAASLNFDSLANTEAPCVYTIRGCTDSTAINYVSQANTDDGGCVMPIVGCMSPGASNFDSTANIDIGDGVDIGGTSRSCRYDFLGCADSHSLNYLSSATVDDGSCIPLVLGCTAQYADNYDSTANALGPLPNNVCRFPHFGCTSSTAVNFDPTATRDDGTCRAGVRGCTFPAAANYDPLANINDGSCEFAPIGCTDSGALNYNSKARDPVPFDGGASLLAPSYRYILEGINRHRDTHCAGGLQWDLDLATRAQTFATTCPIGPSAEAAGGAIGELSFEWTSSAELTTLFNSLSLTQTEKYQGLGRIVSDTWYAGVVDYPFPAPPVEPSLDGFDRWSSFTQMVWMNHQ